MCSFCRTIVHLFLSSSPSFSFVLGCLWPTKEFVGFQVGIQKTQKVNDNISGLWDIDCLILRRGKTFLFLFTQVTMHHIQYCFCWLALKVSVKGKLECKDMLWVPHEAEQLEELLLLAPHRPLHLLAGTGNAQKLRKHCKSSPKLSISRDLSMKSMMRGGNLFLGL